MGNLADSPSAKLAGIGLACGLGMMGCASQPPLDGEPEHMAEGAGPASAPPPTIVSPAESASATPPPAASSAVAEPPEKSPFAVVDSAPTSTGAPAPLYAELFTKGTKWKVTLKTTGRSPEKPKQPVTTTKGACSVVSVETKSWGVVARVDCGDVGAEPLVGWWVATAVGLFHFVDEPTSVPTFTEDALVSKASPEKKTTEVREPGAPNVGVSLTFQPKGKAWCKSISPIATDGAWRTVCIEAKKGFVSGGWGSGAGVYSEGDVTATLAK